MDAPNPGKITARDILSADVVTLNVDIPVVRLMAGRGPRAGPEPAPRRR